MCCIIPIYYSIYRCLLKHRQLVKSDDPSNNTLNSFQTIKMGPYAQLSADSNYNISVAGAGLMVSSTGSFNHLAITSNFSINNTIAGSAGAQTINKSAGAVIFSSSDSSIVVTNSLVSSTSLILATVATNDATLKSVIAVAGSGSFTLTPNANATSNTQVNWLVIN